MDLEDDAGSVARSSASVLGGTRRRRCALEALREDAQIRRGTPMSVRAAGGVWARRADSGLFDPWLPEIEEWVERSFWKETSTKSVA